MPHEARASHKAPIISCLRPSESYRLRRHFLRHSGGLYSNPNLYGTRLVTTGTLSLSTLKDRILEAMCGPAKGPHVAKPYQLALVTPGISPFDAISRNWIRLRPN